MNPFRGGSSRKENYTSSLKGFMPDQILLLTKFRLRLLKGSPRSLITFSNSTQAPQIYGNMIS